jgi:hypothetical protein
MTLTRSGMLFSIYSIIIFLTIIITIPSINIDHIDGFTIKNYFEVYASPFALGDFTSASNIPEDFNFGAAGDWGCTSDTIKTLENILDKSPELMLGLGDYSYEDSAQCWLDMIDPIADRTMIAIGNHDVESPEKLDAYMNYFGLKEQYYSFDYENIHFTTISIELPFEEGSSQYSFVNNDLEKASMDPNIDWIVVYYHNLAYTSPADVGKGNGAEKELRDTYHPLFDKYNVDLVLQAHNHNYQRSYPVIYNVDDSKNPTITDNDKNKYYNPKGIIFSTIGTGGAEAYPLTGQAPYISNQYIGFGFLNIDVMNNGETLSGKFYANDGSIKDHFTITKPRN